MDVQDPAGGDVPGRHAAHRPGGCRHLGSRDQSGDEHLEPDALGSDRIGVRPGCRNRAGAHEGALRDAPQHSGSGVRPHREPGCRRAMGGGVQAAPRGYGTVRGRPLGPRDPARPGAAPPVLGRAPRLRPDRASHRPGSSHPSRRSPERPGAGRRGNTDRKRRRAAAGSRGDRHRPARPPHVRHGHQPEPTSAAGHPGAAGPELRGQQATPGPGPLSGKRRGPALAARSPDVGIRGCRRLAVRPAEGADAPRDGGLEAGSSDRRPSQGREVAADHPPHPPGRLPARRRDR